MTNLEISPDSGKIEGEEVEQVLWRSDVTKGIFRKKIVHTYLVTNKQVISGNQILNLEDISDAVSLNEERVHGIHSGHSSVRVGSYRDKGRVIGDVIFNSTTLPDLIFHDIPDPDGIVRLVKSLIKQRNKK
jgi:hypothetical protein